MSSAAKSSGVITTGMLILMTVGAVDSIRNLPVSALFGSKIIAFYLLASFFFLIPSAMVAAALAAQFPEDSGIYSWVKRAMGARWGFVAVWLQWVENAPFFPAVLSFVAATLAYVFFPAWANNKVFLWAFVLVVFWALTLINARGIQLSAWFSSLCTVLGLLVPMALLMVMGVIWVSSGHTMAMHLSRHNLMPHFSHLSNWVTMQGVLLSLCGIELATVHAKDTRNPQKAFPFALLVSVVVIVATLVMGALSIAFMIPASQLSLVSGIMATFGAFLSAFHLHWALPVVGVMLAIGSLGGVNSWIIGPTRGLRLACKEGGFKPFMVRQNRHEAPEALLLFQAVLVSIVISLFFLVPSVNAAYWLLSVLAAQIYMLMYVLMFVASMMLCWRHRDTHDAAYRIPGGMPGHMLVSALGLFGSVVAFFICFIPPSVMHLGSLGRYEMLLVGGLVVLCCLPVLFRGKQV